MGGYIFAGFVWIVLGIVWVGVYYFRGGTKVIEALMSFALGLFGFIVAMKRRESSSELEMDVVSQQNITTKNSASRHIHPAIIALFIVIILFVLVGLVGLIPKQDRGATPSMAYVQCKIFIRNALKAPSIAEFPDYVYAKIKDFGDGEYLVGLYVDAENSFGAKIRQNFVCDVKYIGNDNWMLIDLK